METKSRQKKQDVRVDFTPMVDMMMLLITFFMLCTSLIKPKSMEINMPTNKDDIKEEQQNKVKASEAITLLFDGEDKIYYYEGIPEMGSLKEADYTANGIRAMLLRRNYAAVQKVRQLRQEYNNNLTADAFEEKKAKEQLDKKIEEIRGEKGVPNVIIKGTDEGSYENLVSCLNEMQICEIGKYVIVPIEDFDKEMIAFYKENGTTIGQ